MVYHHHIVSHIALNNVDNPVNQRNVHQSYAMTQNILMLNIVVRATLIYFPINISFFHVTRHSIYFRILLFAVLITLILLLFHYLKNFYKFYLSFLLVLNYHVDNIRNKHRTILFFHLVVICSCRYYHRK